MLWPGAITMETATSTWLQVTMALGATNYIYINRGGVFTETITLPAATGQTLSLAWGDFDQDHDLDLAVGNRTVPAR